jgi:hypothetical protein
MYRNYILKSTGLLHTACYLQIFLESVCLRGGFCTHGLNYTYLFIYLFMGLTFTSVGTDTGNYVRIFIVPVSFRSAQFVC